MHTHRHQNSCVIHISTGNLRPVTSGVGLGIHTRPRTWLVGSSEFPPTWPGRLLFFDFFLLGNGGNVESWVFRSAKFVVLELERGDKRGGLIQKIEIKRYNWNTSWSQSTVPVAWYPTNIFCHEWSYQRTPS